MGTKSLKMYAVRRKSDGKFHCLVGPHCENRWVNSPNVWQSDQERCKAEREAANLQCAYPELKDDVEVCELTVSWETQLNRKVE